MPNRPTPKVPSKLSPSIKAQNQSEEASHCKTQVNLEQKEKQK